MRKVLLTLSAIAALGAGSIGVANAVDVGVGPNGVYVGPGHHRDYYDRDRADCRVIIDHRTNRFGEDVTVRRRICD